MTISEESQPLILQGKNGSGNSYNSVQVQSKTKLEKSVSPTKHFSALAIDDHITYSWKELTVKNSNSCCQKAANKLTQKPIVKKALITDVYGEAKPGELLAIMGSSGAGKTTLLNCLTFRTDRNLEISGFRMINGVPVNSRTIAAISGYVQQVDLFIGTLTVKESLIFHAMLRMRKGMPFANRLARVEEVMLELNLKKCENTIVGIPGKIKGISGGEMKRLSFAAEVLTDPPILFCDEPTSGLDSFMAQNVVSVMREMARKGKTVISTIHQPSSEVFAMFDKVVFMAEGKVAFLGSHSLAGTFFKSLGSECPTNHNPADYYIHLLAIAPGKERECRHTIAMICDAFSNSKTGLRLRSVMESGDKELIEASHRLKKKSQYKADWCQQFVAVFWRSWISVLKDPSLLRAKLIQSIMVALIIGLIYFQQKLDQDGVMNINGAIFVALANMTFQNMFAVIHVFCAELPIFMREHSNGMYRTDVYFLAKTFAELPLFITQPTLFTSIVYYMIGMNPDVERFLGATAVLVLIANISTSFGYVVSCACSNVGIALSLAPPIVVPFLLFGGYFLNTRSIPWYIAWFQHLSWFKYGNEAMLINQWKGVDNIPCTRMNTTCPKNGLIILETLNFNEKNFTYDMFMLTALLGLFRLLAFFALLIRSIFKLV